MLLRNIAREAKKGRESLGERKLKECTTLTNQLGVTYTFLCQAGLLSVDDKSSEYQK